MFKLFVDSGAYSVFKSGKTIDIKKYIAWIKKEKPELYANFFIEARNAFMVMAAMAYCSANKIDELLAGYILAANEWEKYWSYKVARQDNSPTFVDAINLLSQMGLSYPVRFRAPFLEQRMGKDDVFHMGQQHGVHYDKTYSCYFTPACGKCDNCLLRAQLLQTATVAEA